MLYPQLRGEKFELMYLGNYNVDIQIKLRVIVVCLQIYCRRR